MKKRDILLIIPICISLIIYLATWTALYIVFWLLMKLKSQKGNYKFYDSRRKK